MSLMCGCLTICIVAVGFLLDWIFGDPAWLYHPIRLIGALITLLTRCIRKLLPKTKSGEITGGLLLVILTVGCSAAASFLILYFLYRIHPAIGFAAEAFFCGQLIAAHSLKKESMAVYSRLIEHDLPGARTAVSMIVGRDTDSLTEEGVAKATVETVAENASDGVIAPLFWMMIGGAVFGFGYKAVNTMDSMVGYKNDEFRHFGTCAAVFDDIVNYIPARLAAMNMILASGMIGMDRAGAFRVWKRDRRKHASPNSAQTESVTAGALGIRLADDAVYFGKTVHKQHIGDEQRPTEPEDIIRANRLMMAGSWLSLLMFSAARIAVVAAAAGLMGL